MANRDEGEGCPWYEQMAGGWCLIEYATIWGSIGSIADSDGSCALMKSTLFSWLETGRITKAWDLPPGTLAGTGVFRDRPFAERHGGTNMGSWASWPPGETITRVLRHEYGHVHGNFNQSWESTVHERYDNSCGGGGSGNGGVGEPSPAVE